MTWVGYILKPQINQVLQCLAMLKSQSRIEQARKLINDFAEKLHVELGSLSRLKWNIENCLTVNLNMKENLCKKKRSFASKFLFYCCLCKCKCGSCFLVHCIKDMRKKSFSCCIQVLETRCLLAPFNSLGIHLTAKDWRAVPYSLECLAVATLCM
jgi:hypothetical protein